MSLKSAIAAALLLSAGWSQTATLITLAGPDGKTVQINQDDLSKLSQHTVKTSEHDKPATFQGVLLSDLLAKLNLPAGEKLRGKLLALYLVVEAADGYSAVFALPEFDPAFTDRKAYLVTAAMANPWPKRKDRFESWCRMRSGPPDGSGR